MPFTKLKWARLPSPVLYVSHSKRVLTLTHSNTHNNTGPVTISKASVSRKRVEKDANRR